MLFKIRNKLWLSHRAEYYIAVRLTDDYIQKYGWITQKKKKNMDETLKHRVEQ